MPLETALVFGIDRPAQTRYSSRMRDNRGIDIMDTVVGAMHSGVGRVLSWAALAAIGLTIGGVGWLLHLWLARPPGGGAGFLDPLSQLGEVPLLLAIPFAWVLILMGCLMHWIGLVYLPFIIIGTFLYLSDEERQETLMYLHLVIGPWPILAIILEGVPWGALLVWVPWSLAWGILGWRRCWSPYISDLAALSELCVRHSESSAAPRPPR